MAQPLLPADLPRSEFARTFGHIIRTRMAVAPFVAVLVLLLAAFETAPWRRVVLVLVPAGVLVVSLVELRRFGRQGMTDTSIELNLTVMVAGQLIISAATGGVESPGMVLLPVIALFNGLLVVGRPWFHRAVVLTHLASPWLLAAVAAEGWVPDFNLDLFGGGPRAGHGDVHLYTQAAVLNLAGLIAHAVGRGLRRVFDTIIGRALGSSEALRQEYAERTRQLFALTSEIAHELKNPMASVKGLAALLGTTVVDGKGQERLSVLRGEVDRMHGILEEFLNFSRPLLPLSVEPLRLGAVCEEVLAMHEGVARERGVELLARGDAGVPGDERKVKQILINLVQNAIDASPRGGTVELEVGGDGQGATVRVLDRGRGIEPGVRGRLFEPGMTTKPKGNGVGLTVARALARQHGGEVTLEDRGGGGCAAVMVLPHGLAPDR